jgi:hypothetical protein
MAHSGWENRPNRARLDVPDLAHGLKRGAETLLEAPVPDQLRTSEAVEYRDSLVQGFGNEDQIGIAGSCCCQVTSVGILERD